MKKWASLLLTLIISFNMSISALGSQTDETNIEIFVEQGSAGGDGSYRNPFGTFEEARDYIRELKNKGNYPADGVTVNFREGIYPIATTMSLSAQDSGTTAGPVVYQAYQNEKVEFVGGIYFDPQEADGVTEQTAKNRINADVISNIKQIPLSELGLTKENFGEIDLRGSGASFLFTMGYTNSTPYPDLFFDNERMNIARWPNADEEQPYSRIQTVIERGTDASVTEMEDARGMIFTADIPEEKLDIWKGQEDIWLHGFWYYDWSDSTVQIENIDALNKTIETKHPSAYKTRTGQRFYAYNILEELDAPGEWYLDKDTDNLYVYPPGEGEILLSTFTGTLLSISNASNIFVKGIDFKATRGSAVVVRGCDEVGIEDAVVACTADYGVQITSCNESYLINSEICATGGPGAGVSGGDFTTLTAGKNYIDNCHIHNFAERDYTNTPGVHVSGVGNTLSHCEIHEGSHQAIRFNGNDNIMEYNNIYNVCKDVDDAAAIYTYKGVVKRGNIIRHNYIHDLVTKSTATAPVGVFGVYNDGGMCGNIIVSNIFENIAGSGGAVMLGNRNHTVANNIVIDCYSVVRTVGTGIYSMASGAEYDAAGAGLTSDFYKKPPYTKYDNLANILEDEPFLTKYNVVKNNVQYSKSKFIGYRKDIVFSHVPTNDVVTEGLGVTVDTLYPDVSEEEKETILAEMESDTKYLAKALIKKNNNFSDSYMTYTDPGFADVENGNYTVLENSLIYDSFSDFKAPDFENIGLRKTPTFSVNNVTLEDENAKKILKLSDKTDKVTVTVDFKIDDGKERDVLLLVGLYDDSGKLLKSDFIEDKITSQNTKVSLSDFSGCTQQNVYLSCYIWERFGTLIPLDISYRY